MRLTSIALHWHFTDLAEVIVPLDDVTTKPCCRLVDPELTDIDAGPGSLVMFTDGTLRSIRVVGLFRTLPTIVGAKDGASSPTFAMTGRELIAAVESGELVAWSVRPPRWKVAVEPRPVIR